MSSPDSPKRAAPRRARHFPARPSAKSMQQAARRAGPFAFFCAHSFRDGTHICAASRAWRKLSDELRDEWAQLALCGNPGQHQVDELVVRQTLCVRA
jgi:hypothetical protein